MPKTFLAVGAHMDDAELGAGGVLIQAARAGHRVVIVTVVSDYSTWENTIGREKQVKQDLIALAKRYGFEKRFLDYPYHQIDGGDLELKKKLAEIYVELKPDAAFIHHHEDHFPDHVACSRASKDAFLFSHGLTKDRTIQRCPLILSYTVTSAQTYRFEPGTFYDVTPVMADFMELIVGTDCCLSGKKPDEIAKYSFSVKGEKGDDRTFRLGEHGRTKLADCINHGYITGSLFAQGFVTAWGQRRGPTLF
ncbi:MAG TPA: PIG-L deacetylase family protein [Planctomycetota bacterium]|nr:PIG-L deacetylase family protein [Planctomycetota bacterium]